MSLILSRLEVVPSDVKSVYVAACYLKMERVASQCAAHLLDSLTPESCLDVRALPGIAQNEQFVKQLETYIRTNVSTENHILRTNSNPVDNFFSCKQNNLRNVCKHGKSITKVCFSSNKNLVNKTM